VFGVGRAPSENLVAGELGEGAIQTSSRGIQLSVNLNLNASLREKYSSDVGHDLKIYFL